MKHLLAVLAVAAAALAAVPLSYAGPLFFRALLDGPSESPANASPGTGIALVAFDTVAHTMHVHADFSGLTANTTAAHIHCCTAVPNVGTAGVATQTPSFTGFPLGVTSGIMDTLFDMTLATSYNPAFLNNATNLGSTATAEATLFNGILAERAYFNIHTSAFPGGEIRGFLQRIPEPGSIALLGLGITALAFTRRHRH